ncbi:MAG TPA: TonB-dependent receptor [Candidatus Acidoferrum sp.]|nr:TonB-dependent receptor [Candidatus Acidoferrum sp.]
MKYVCILLLAMVAGAQESIHYASVGGRVTDPSGKVVAGAEVRARHIDTNTNNVLATDSEGRFRFAYLRVGAWEITVARTGFAVAKQTLTVAAGGAYDLPVTLALASGETAVTVTGESASLETARSQMATTVSPAEVRSLPLSGRSFLDLTLFVPGVSPTNTASTQLFSETSAVPGQGISIGSQRNFSNNFVVDGLSANDDAAGLAGAFYGIDSVSQVQVVTSGAQAELGRALGGYVNVVTRSGTNATHGDLYGYFRNQRFNASNPLSHAVLPLTQAQYGASAGGPLSRDRTFYFANVERRELNQSGLITISPANIDAINARLSAIGYPGPRIATGIYANPVHSTNVLAKIDHQVSAKDQASLRYSLYDVNSVNSRGAGGLSAASASANLDNYDHTLAAGNVATLSANTVNETRGQVTWSNLQAPPSDPLGPAVSISGVATFGTLSGSPTGRRNTMYEIVDNLSHRAGAHTVRVGVDFLYNASDIVFPRSSRGSYSFSSLASFLAGTYNNAGFTQTFGAASVSQGNPNAGFYLQDEWKASRGFTLNLGVRYDVQWLDSIVTDRNNFAPRLGFAWSPGESRRTVVRGSFGLFYDRVPLRALANALLSAGNTTNLANLIQPNVSLSPAQAGAPVFPAILSTLVPSVTLPNLSTMDRRMQNAYSEQGSIEIERQLGSTATLGVGYQHLKGLHLIASINRNVPSCVAAGNNNGCRPDPTYANNSQYSPIADSQYDGLHVSFVQRPSKWGSYRISYTWSKSLDDVGEFFFSSPLNPYNIRQDYGRSDDDQRHRVAFAGTLHAPLGIEVSGTMQYYSALPFNITTGAQTVQGTTARPLVNGVAIARNSGSGFDLWSVNARVSRGFRLAEHAKLEAMVESFNALNHVNGVSLNGTFGTGAYPANPSPVFGQVTAVGDPRSLQLGLRLGF